MCFRTGSTSRTELAKSNSLAIIGTTTAPVNKGRVVSMHIKVIIVDEEALSHSGVSVVKCVNVEPKRQETDLSS